MALIDALPEHSAQVHVSIESLDLLRILTVAEPHLTIDRLVLTVTKWQRPIPRWVGRPGQIPHLSSFSTRYAEGDDEQAHVDIELSKPTSLASVARGAYPLLGVTRGQHGYGFAELATADIRPTALALLPSRTAPGIPPLPSAQLSGVGLSRADVGLVGSEHMLEELRAASADPERDFVRHPLLVEPDGHLTVSERFERPIVDLNVHNPIGRLHIFDRPPGALALTAKDGVLTFTPYDLDPEAEEIDGWSRPTAAVLSGTEVTRLREIESIDLSGLRPDGVPGDEMLQYRRLAELAATGVILHSLPPSFGRAEEILGSALAALLRAPYRPSTGLVRELRTVPQRRDAMQRFGGFFELAANAEQIGFRLLPTVSVVLSSTRPTRLPRVLRALAAQEYPHLEIVVALHGVDTPVDGEFEEAVRASGAVVFHHDRSTPFGAVLAETARRSTGDLVVKIDDDDFYGPHVIGDLVLAHLYSNADIAGKTTEYLYFEHIDHTAHRKFQTERYHTQVAGGAMMLSRAALNEVGGWRPSTNSTDRSILIRVGNSGGISYRTHSLGYVYVRHSDGHTWDRTDSMLLRGASEQWPRFMPEIVEA